MLDSSLSPKSDNNRVLLAEDDPANRIVAQHMLEALGYEVDMAMTGLDAIEKVKNRIYDAVVMDISMPHMNGFDAVRFIRKYERGNNLPRTPIICVTAHVLVGEREKCLAAGMDDYLGKPYRMEEFEEKLGALVKRAA